MRVTLRAVALDALAALVLFVGASAIDGRAASAEPCAPLLSTVAVGMPSVEPPAVEPEPATVEAPAAEPEPPLLLLKLASLGTAERMDITPLDRHGQLFPDAAAILTPLFAQRTTKPPTTGPDRDAVAPDPALVDLLIRISAELGDRPITVVSGHRKPGRGTGKHSFHVRGEAADVAVAGVKVMDVRSAALRAGAGGVGLYPGFVHVDVRTTPYRWSGGWGRRRSR